MVELAELISRTSNRLTKNSVNCSARCLGFSRNLRFLVFFVRTEDTEYLEGRGRNKVYVELKPNVNIIRAILINKMNFSISNLPVNIACTCQAYLYWGVKYNLGQIQRNIGRKETRAPNIRDPKQVNFVCKHIKSVIDTFGNTPIYLFKVR